MRYYFPFSGRRSERDDDRPYDDGWTGALRRLGQRRGWLALGGLAVVGVIGALALSDGDERSATHESKEPPLIKAQEQPIKEHPEHPGGMDVPYRDRLIYEQLRGADESSKVERLLPEPEQPRLPPAATPGPTARSGPEAGAPSSSYGPSDEAEAQDEPTPLGPSHGSPSATPSQPPSRSALAAPPSPVPVKPPAATAPTPAGGFQVQLVAVHSREQAESAWERLRKQHPDVLGNLQSSIVRADRGNQGILYRLRAGPIDGEAKARATCTQLASRKTDCVVIQPGG